MTRFDWASRSSESEHLDSSDFCGIELAHALCDLERFNHWLGGNRSVIRAIRRALALLPKRPLTVVDIGCGSGDALRALAKWSAAQSIPLRLYGLDANPSVIELARNRSRHVPNISYVVGDAFGPELRSLEPDIVVANQFFHHFPSSALEEHVPSLLRHTRALVISDLHRSVVAHAGFGVLARLLNASPLAIHDGLVSIRRGFRRPELEALVAGVPHARRFIHWAFPFRYELVLMV
jgi:SAM-dependent methyltransferase